MFPPQVLPEPSVQEIICRKLYPQMKVVATEAAECPTLLNNGFGGHSIEGIGDKHVPWVHNVRNTDAVAAIRDEDCMRLFRLFNQTAGLSFIHSLGIKPETAEKLSLLGISSICQFSGCHQDSQVL